MRDYLTIGSTPYEEPCIQVLKDVPYMPLMKKEAEVYKRQLERQFPDEPEGTFFTIKTFPHDFGAYVEVCVLYDNDDEESCDFAFSVENETPAEWDEIALEELKNIEGYYSMLNHKEVV